MPIYNEQLNPAGVDGRRQASMYQTADGNCRRGHSKVDSQVIAFQDCRWGAGSSYSRISMVGLRQALPLHDDI